MIKIYGMDTCPDCTYIKEQIAGREEEFSYIEIGTHVKYMKEFLKIRDNNPVFEEAKKEGKAGIPCFVLENETVTLNAEDVGLKNREVEENQQGSAIL